MLVLALIAVMCLAALAAASLMLGRRPAARPAPRGVVGRVVREVGRGGGVIEVDGELWPATAAGRVAAGDWVRLLGVEGDAVRVAAMARQGPPPSGARGARQASRPAGWRRDAGADPDRAATGAAGRTA